jgi:hypothetical protein
LLIENGYSHNAINSYTTNLRPSFLQFCLPGGTPLKWVSKNDLDLTLPVTCLVHSLLGGGLDTGERAGQFYAIAVP